MRGLVVAGLAALLAGCAGGPPPLARGVLLEPVASRRDVSADWSARLAERFPAGTPTADVEAVLRRDGFAVDGEARSGRYVWTGFPCAHTLEVEWRADDAGRLTAIAGRYSEACT